MGYVELLRARGIDSREVSQRRSKTLKFCERIEGSIVIEVVVDCRLLIVGEGMIDLDLKLVAPISLFRNADHLACTARRRKVQICQRHGHRVKALRGNLVIDLCVEIRENPRRDQFSTTIVSSTIVIPRGNR